MNRSHAFLGLLTSLWVACGPPPISGVGGSGGTAGTAGSAGTAGGAGTSGSGGNPAPDPYNADCSSARWSNVSPSCWSCMCGACKEQLDACGEGCMKGFECALEKNTLVGAADEIPCEIRGTGIMCLTSPETQAGAAALITFDTCLIARHQAPQQLRVCEQECGITYSGDVCQRFP